MSMIDQVLQAQQMQALAELRREQTNSIELTRNAKGEYQWTIKAYYAQGEEQAALDAQHFIDQSLRDLYIITKGATDA